MARGHELVTEEGYGPIGPGSVGRNVDRRQLEAPLAKRTALVLRGNENVNAGALILGSPLNGTTDLTTLLVLLPVGLTCTKRHP